MVHIQHYTGPPDPRPHPRPRRSEEDRVAAQRAACKKYYENNREKILAKAKSRRVAQLELIQKSNHDHSGAHTGPNVKFTTFDATSNRQPPCTSSSHLATSAYGELSSHSSGISGTSTSGLTSALTQLESIQRIVDDFIEHHFIDDNSFHEFTAAMFNDFSSGSCHSTSLRDQLPYLRRTLKENCRLIQRLEASLDSVARCGSPSTYFKIHATNLPRLSRLLSMNGALRFKYTMIAEVLQRSLSHPIPVSP